MVKNHRNRADSFRGPLAAGRQSGNYSTPDSHNIAASLPRTNDENSKLGQILEDFTQEIIDISVVDHHGDTLLQTEINEKMAFYSGKLEGAGGRIVRNQREEGPGQARLNRTETR